MTDEVYPSGPDLSGIFLVIPDEPPLLPDDFDTKCKCGKELERVQATYWTRRRPLAVFVCDHCPCRLYLFEAPRIPLILAQEDFPRSSKSNGSDGSRTSLESACFSEFVDLLIERREEKWRRNLERTQRAGKTASDT